MKHRLLPAICRRATRIIADSHQTRQDLVRLFELDEAKIDVVHLGVSSTFQRVTDEEELSNVRARYRLPSRFVLYLGALEPRKNLETLIDAMALLRRAGTDEPLVIAGSGLESYEQKLGAHVRRAGLIPDRDVYFAGHVEDRDLPALYSASELFAFPSRYEGFGLPPLEAMACGVPVVLASNSSMAEVYAGTCTMVDGDDASTFADAMHATLVDSCRKPEWSSRGLELAGRLGWQRTCADTLAVYERAIRG
jgi:glycosyltransferase involved in cell wall biosynthesis